MRPDGEVLKLIADFAALDDDIEYVIQNGSRVNPNITPDRYADYDIIMGCEKFEKFLTNRSWIARFGSLLILQLNTVEEAGMSWPIFLMQFEDGLRIDLQFYPGDGPEKFRADSLSKLLLDKTGLFKELAEPSEESYITRKPSNEDYLEEINEFWWCAINVAKGIARHELTYSMYMYESIVRGSFLQIVSWLLGSRYDWRINTGKFGKFIERYADDELWRKIRSTYATDTDPVFWDSMINACRLMADADEELRGSLGLENCERENAVGIIEFIQRIRAETR